MAATDELRMRNNTAEQCITSPEDSYMQEVETLLQKLTPREEQILRMRFGIGTTPHQAADVGRGLGLSAATVTRIQGRALHRLRMLALDAG